MSTILFDLDGTLVPLDQDTFLSEYFKLLASEVGHLISPSKIPDIIMASTMYMINESTKDKTNKEAFMEDFETRTDHDIDDLMAIFDRFYAGRFDQLGSMVRRRSEITETIDILKEKRYDLICATNPLFPRPAIEARIRWIGLSPDDFVLVTTYEDMHFCKPHLTYYEEILNKAHKEADECMMVGNDVEEDMVASRLGMKTYLIKDYVIDRKSGLKPDYEGSYSDLLEFVKALPELKAQD